MYFHVVGESGFLFDMIFFPKFSVRCYHVYLVSCSFQFSPNRIFPRSLELVDTLSFLFCLIFESSRNELRETNAKCKNHAYFFSTLHFRN